MRLSYDQIKTELHQLRDLAKTDPEAVDQIRAQSLVGMLMQMGVRPRRVRLNLRALGLSAKQLVKRPRADRTSGPTSATP